MDVADVYGRRVQFRVLGPLEVDAGDGPLPLGGPKQRVVLANLLVRANQVVPVDTLIHGVWGEEPPEKARNTLQTYVSNLRGAIGDGRLLGRSPGYVLMVGPTELDATSFDEALREAKRTLPMDPTIAVSALEDALALWRGPALADVADQSSLVAEAARLDELRFEAQERRIEGLLASGSSGRAIGELEVLLAEQSLREGLWALLMLGLYREGRQADALNAFRRAREILADELGIDPSPELSRLYERILMQDPGLELRGEPLRGYRLLEKIDDGPTGVTFRAIQPHVGRDVAVKIFHERVANDPAFVRRFERDAQSIAGLEHPHIVPVYDYWREPGRAYLVSRYLRGGSLRAIEDRGEVLGSDRADRVVEQIASALEFAHRQGTCHGNVRASNILFDAEGNAYLGDFRVGEDPGGPAEDDAMFTRLATGLLGEQATERLEAIGRIERPARPTRITRNPYKGLRPFTEADAPDFFGRGELVQRLMGRLSETGPPARFLAVVGPSGSGKSSVVRAGLLPAIRDGGSGSSERPYVAEMFPGVHPIDELEAAFLRVAVRPVPQLRALLGGSSRGPLAAAELVTPTGAEVVLLVDQLEELFTLTTDEREREQFLGSLRVATADPDSRIRVIVTLRADFFDRPLIYPRFGELLAARTEVVPPFTPDELEQAIREPAERLGVRLEPGLVAEMIADVTHQPGALPLLQYALTELFERRDETSMTLGAYREIGGVAGALSARAERLYASADADGQHAIRQVFLRLVTLGEGREDTRRRVARGELDTLDVDARTDTVLDAFGRHRLLTFDREPATREPTVEIAHEALLGTWDRLRTWIDEAREDLRLERRLSRAAAEWRGSGRDPSFLMRGSRLGQIDAWAGNTGLALGRDDRAYLRASIDERDREHAEEERRRERERTFERRSVRRLRGLVAVFAAAALIAGSLTLIATNQSARAEREARTAAARELAAAAVANLDVDPQRSLLLAIESAERTRSVDGSVLPETEDALHRAILASRELLSLPDVGGSVDWGHGAVVAEGPPTSGTIELRDPASGEEVRTIGAHDGEVSDLAMSADGRTLASTGTDGFLRVWDTSTGEELAAIRGRGTADGASLAPGGSFAAAAWTSDGSGSVMILDLTTGERAGRFPFLSPVDTSFDQLGRRLAVADAGASAIDVVDARTGRTLRSLSDRFEPVSVSWSPDGRHIAAGGVLNGRVWEADHGRLIGTLSSGLIESVDWSPDSTHLVTGGNDGAVRIWELTETGVLEALKLPARTASGAFEAAFAPDGDRVIAGDGASAFASAENAGLKIWDISGRGDAEWANVPSAGNYPGDATFFASGDRLVANAGDERLAIWQLDVGREDRRVGGLGGFPTRGGGYVWKIVVAPDDRHLLVTLSTTSFELDRVTGARARVFPGAVESEAHPDGEHLAVATTTGSLRIVDRSGRGPELLDSEREGVWGLDFNADGRLLAVAEPYLLHSPPRVTIWDVTTRQLVTSIDTESETVDFSPDGMRIVTAARNGLPIVWDTRTGARLATLASRSSGAVWDPVFSPDGSSVAIGTASGTVRLVDPETGLDQMVLRGRDGGFTRLAFSPDGSMLAAKNFGGEGTVRVWALDLDDLLEVAHQKLTRTWTDDECRQFLHMGACPAASA